MLEVCICTYKRPERLRLLLHDVELQRVLPERVMVVDGDPASGDVSAMLPECARTASFEICYLPSNYPSLPYQRYLGWLASSRECILVFLDDDLRLDDPQFLLKLTAPFNSSDGKIAAVTGTFISGPELFEDARALFTNRGPRPWRYVFHLLGVRRGELSATGARDFPKDRGSGYERIGWLAGGAMAIRAQALTESCFLESAFDADLVGLGDSEDLLLATRIGRAGAILLAYCAVAQHPGLGPSAFGSKSPHQMGFSWGYSRCLINACHGGRDGPTVWKRIILLWSTLGTIMLNLFRMAAHRDGRYWSYSKGLLAGLRRGFLQNPFTGAFSPQICWSAAAARAVAGRRTVGKRSTPSVQSERL